MTSISSPSLRRLTGRIKSPLHLSLPMMLQRSMDRTKVKRPTLKEKRKPSRFVLIDQPLISGGGNVDSRSLRRENARLTRLPNKPHSPPSVCFALSFTLFSRDLFNLPSPPAHFEVWRRIRDLSAPGSPTWQSPRCPRCTPRRCSP